jgi:hypothetical protein
VCDYGLDDRAIGVRSPAGSEDFSSNLCVQTGSGAHPASCPMGAAPCSDVSEVAVSREQGFGLSCYIKGQGISCPDEQLSVYRAWFCCTELVSVAATQIPIYAASLLEQRRCVPLFVIFL